MTRVWKLATAAGLGLALTSGAARADQVFGVDVYRKAELLPAKSAVVKRAVAADAACYRTADPVDAVRSFYAKLRFVSAEASVLRRGNVEVVLHPPDAAGGSSRYTTFCIVQPTP